MKNSLEGFKSLLKRIYLGFFKKFEKIRFPVILGFLENIKKTDVHISDKKDEQKTKQMSS